MMKKLSNLSKCLQHDYYTTGNKEIKVYNVVIIEPLIYNLQKDFNYMMLKQTKLR